MVSTSDQPAGRTTYRLNDRLQVESVIDLYADATLGNRRPIADVQRRHASLLNAVQSSFGSLDRQAIHRSVCPSVQALRDEKRRFIRVHNAEVVEPFKWTKEAGVILEAVARAKRASGY